MVFTCSQFCENLHDTDSELYANSGDAITQHLFGLSGMEVDAAAQVQDHNLVCVEWLGEVERECGPLGSKNPAPRRRQQSGVF